MSKEELKTEASRLWGLVKDADFEGKKKLLNQIYAINEQIRKMEEV